MTMGLKIRSEELENKKIFRLEGRIDANTASILEKKISELLPGEGKHKAMMDFSQVNYLSSAGIRVLLAAAKRVKSQGGLLVFCGMNQDLLGILKMAGFDRVLSIYPTESEALAAL